MMWEDTDVSEDKSSSIFIPLEDGESIVLRNATLHGVTTHKDMNPHHWENEISSPTFLGCLITGRLGFYESICSSSGSLLL
jgi:hypothetical protein